MDATELAAATGPHLNAAGAAFYFHPDTLATGKELGLDGFRFYALGRASVLGDVAPEVVQAAFGYFTVDLIAKIHGSAKQTLAPAEAAPIYHRCCADWGRAHLADVEGLDAFCRGAEAIIAAQPPAGLSLYAGWAAQPLVDDLPGRAAQLAAVLRELRGSVHLVALLASGLTDQQAHYLKRPDDYEAFGWGEPHDVDDSHRAAMDAAEDLTNRMLAPAFGAIAEDDQAAFVAAVEAIRAASGR